MLKIALICGGPSSERGISLNSARSVMDHLSGPDIQIIPLYVDFAKDFYLLSPSQLYSNTPSDFDYKLDSMAGKLSREELKTFFQSIDFAFPVIHGAYGEGGELQEILEENKVHYIGSEQKSCREMFCKYSASEKLKQKGFYTIPSICIASNQPDKLNLIQEFFSLHALQRAIIKPTRSGSSIGVYSVRNPNEAFQACSRIFEENIDDKVLLEVFCEGQEFTVLVLENEFDVPIALIPTEIEMHYGQNQIFDYRRKYLPTNQAIYHTPPRFEIVKVDQIRQQAQEIFKLFHMRDFARLDGWLLLDGTICFTDINPISGLEQNSFLFRQTSLLGMTHRQTLQYLLKRVCARAKLSFPEYVPGQKTLKHPVYVLFGNDNAERQVSLMSGTNVWLKLLQSEKLHPIPCLYDRQKEIWKLPYSYALNHTVEEIYQNCVISQETVSKTSSYVHSICQSLQLDPPDFALPLKQKLDQFFNQVTKEKAFVFLAMHGGEGEDGTLQKLLEKYQIAFNGSNSKVSALCMDKYQTGVVINQMNDPNIIALPKARIDFCKVPFSDALAYKHLWLDLCQYLFSSELIVKPRSDGCSTGIIMLQCPEDLACYARFVQEQAACIPAHTFKNQKNSIEMSPEFKGEYLLEPYLDTDLIAIEGKEIKHVFKKGWLELTVGVLEYRGQYQSLNPSIAVAEGSILSLEEKFQGGTGINLTPPPEKIISVQATEKIKIMVAKAARALGIQNYARVDIFFNSVTEKMIVIEANTLPALTPSTVLYHQALVENPPLTPQAFIEKIINSKMVTL